MAKRGLERGRLVERPLSSTGSRKTPSLQEEGRAYEGKGNSGGGARGEGWPLPLQNCGGVGSRMVTLGKGSVIVRARPT